MVGVCPWLASVLAAIRPHAPAPMMQTRFELAVVLVGVAVGEATT